MDEPKRRSTFTKIAWILSGLSLLMAGVGFYLALGLVSAGPGNGGAAVPFVLSQTYEIIFIVVAVLSVTFSVIAVIRGEQKLGAILSAILTLGLLVFIFLPLLLSSL